MYATLGDCTYQIFEKAVLGPEEDGRSGKTAHVACQEKGEGRERDRYRVATRSGRLSRLLILVHFLSQPIRRAPTSGLLPIVRPALLLRLIPLSVAMEVFTFVIQYKLFGLFVTLQTNNARFMSLTVLL